jgi:drug/metabolite transporter (DMT)-like permease
VSNALAALFSRAMSDSPASSRLALIAAAALFSTGGAAIKATSLTGWQVACFRSAVAAVALALFLPGARVRPRDWSRWTVAVGGAYAATMVLFVLANKLTTAANTIFLQSTAPLYLLLLGPWLLREPIRRRDLLLLLAMATGLALVIAGREERTAIAPDPVTGNALALASGVCWAFTMLGLRRLSRDVAPGAASPAAAAMVAGNFLAFAATLPLALPVTSGSTKDALLIGYLGVFQIALAYAFVGVGLRRVRALEASLLLLVEPVLNPLIAWLVHGERPGSWTLAGGAVILSATALEAVIPGSDRASPPP